LHLRISGDLEERVGGLVAVAVHGSVFVESPDRKHAYSECWQLVGTCGRRLGGASSQEMSHR
jgi:hypothetical protein